MEHISYIYNRIYISIYLSIYIYISHTFFIHSSVNRHLTCFHVLVVVNSAAMKFQAYLGVSFLDTDIFLFI